MLVSAVPLAAQRPGTIDIGAFGRFTRFDGTLPIDNDRVGAGGRLGVFALSQLAIESEASFTSSRLASGASVSAIPFRLRLAYHAPVSEKVALILGAGWVHDWYRGTLHESDNGVTGILGLRFGVAGALTFRVDGTVDYIERPFNRATAARNVNYGAQAGFGVLLGKATDAKRKDADRDGVPDAFDSCPRSAAGEKVSSTGCPQDGDKDGVPDSRDRCLSSPLGEPVDVNGCPAVRDSDADGVSDGEDKCRNTPAGRIVDASGCPVDEDGDGVLNARDKCPGTAAGTVVDGVGCAPPKDTDKDGVPDDLDRCPNSEPGAKVNASGCVPARDTDGDGVADSIDACPATPPRSTVDAAGCPPLFIGSTPVVLDGVTFESGKSTLLPASRPSLERVARALLASPQMKVEVAGHTDNLGNPTSNLILSQRRADVVRLRLIQLGVPPEQMIARGYGSASPLVPNNTTAGRAANRRVELRQAQ
jgi:outer membrane protein OmpA-like peptidoglycan-associated protein